MRGRQLCLLVAVAACFPSGALAAPVLMMSRDGHVSKRQDRFLNQPDPSPAPVSSAAPGPAPPPGAPRASMSRAPQRTVRSELTRLYRAGRISQSAYQAYQGSFTAALTAEKRLRGVAASELEAVIENLHQIAVRGLLTAPRLPALFLTLDRNRQWWTSGPVPAADARIEFQGSQVVWQYYPGQGLELQVLGTFGKADGLYTAGALQYAALRDLLGEMIPLAVARDGGLAWEYYFHFDGGSPPWISAMAQGTAIEALTRAYEAFSSGSGGTSPGPGAGGGPQLPAGAYLQLAHQALGVFTAPPPAGVAVATPLGTRYLQYSFAPTTDIINAFLQSLIGLYDYAQTSHDAEAQALFARGNAQAQSELPQFDTGAWSLYEPGVEDSLDYHNLVTGFLDQLCSKTSIPVYCTTAAHFHSYLTTPPTLSLLTTTAIARNPVTLRFRLSKYSHVGVVVLRGQQTVFLTSADFGYGTQSFAVPPLGAGRYTVRLAATDLAGNFNRTVATLQVNRRRRGAARPGSPAGH